jgi:hypothetical protein
MVMSFYNEYHNATRCLPFARATFAWRPWAALLLVIALGCGPDNKPKVGNDEHASAAIEKEKPKQEAAPPKPAPIYMTRVGFKTPKSVLYDAKADVYLVSNMNGMELIEDNNGFISKVDPTGRLIKLKWIESGKDGVKLNAPKGMAIVGDSLYVVDIGRVQLFDRETGKPQRTIKIKGATFLNDITAGPDGALYVSDTGFEQIQASFKPSGTDAVYRIESNRVTPFIKSHDLGFPTGLFADNIGVWVANRSGELFRVMPGQRKDTSYKLPKGSLDGIVKTNDGRLMVSSWDGRCVYGKADDGNFVEVAGRMNTPADIGYDTKRNRLLIPLFEKDILVIYPL